MSLQMVFTFSLKKKRLFNQQMLLSRLIEEKADHLKGNDAAKSLHQGKDPLNDDEV